MKNYILIFFVTSLVNSSQGFAKLKEGELGFCEKESQYTGRIENSIITFYGPLESRQTKRARIYLGNQDVELLSFGSLEVDFDLKKALHITGVGYAPIFFDLKRTGLVYHMGFRGDLHIEDLAGGSETIMVSCTFTNYIVR